MAFIRCLKENVIEEELREGVQCHGGVGEEVVGAILRRIMLGDRKEEVAVSVRLVDREKVNPNRAGKITKELATKQRPTELGRSQERVRMSRDSNGSNGKDKRM